jgi:hypothetical protein
LKLVVYSHPSNCWRNHHEEDQFLTVYGCDAGRLAGLHGYSISGFGHFNSDGKTVDDAFMKTCFPCHEKMKERDLVFTRYGP